jgi:hypothetical protein
MLSTALYWNTDRSGIAAPTKKKPSIIASLLVNVVLKKCRRLTASLPRQQSPGQSASHSQPTT